MSMFASNSRYIHYRQQHGAALVIGLILLVVITVLAISGMNTATTEIAMARNDQNYENAFQAAESGLENALAQGNYDTLVPLVLPQFVSATGHEFIDARVEYEDATMVPDKAFSLGDGSGFAAYHFLATSQAESRRDPNSETNRDASAVHTQAFYKVGPESPTF
ncbi:MAG TPA: PilX N-terminal domain-containing pilus assembly protein [Woeseiaceae bacterium]|nr:PilX N-terminal domain-containing pilus assembly protein [Woeseiaceae bacterium]